MATHWAMCSQKHWSTCLAETLPEVNAKILCYTLSDEKAKELVHTLTNTLAEVESKTLGKKLSDVKAEALVHKLPNT